MSRNTGPSSPNRRRAAGSVRDIAVASLLASSGAGTLIQSALAQGAAPAGGFTQWGWPQPYERVSERSIKWLQDKGWWPLNVAYQPPWSGQNAIFVVMNKAELLQKRGLQANLQAFPSGPALNEVFISGRAQVGNGGNLPMNTLIDRQVPMRVIALMSPNLRHMAIVPPDSPLKKLADMKGGNPQTRAPWTIGIATGSSSEFYMQLALAANGLENGKDFTFRNMPPPEQAQMPRGIDMIAPWDFTTSLVVNERKTGRPVDAHFPYMMYLGVTYVRQELVDNVPDVVQAIADAIVEATLWIRMEPEKTVDYLLEDQNLRLVPRTLLAGQVREYNNWFKPTYLYPHTDFWFEENQRTVNWLHQNGRLKTPLTQQEFRTTFRPEYIGRSFEKLGWKVPAAPPFIPAGWRGQVGKPPYPEYLSILNMNAPQAFPEPGDLTRAWTFNGQTFRP